MYDLERNVLIYLFENSQQYQTIYYLSIHLDAIYLSNYVATCYLTIYLFRRWIPCIDAANNIKSLPTSQDQSNSELLKVKLTGSLSRCLLDIFPDGFLSRYIYWYHFMKISFYLHRYIFKKFVVFSSYVHKKEKFMMIVKILFLKFTMGNVMDCADLIFQMYGYC